MSESLPTYLIDTYKMLASAFPRGVDEEIYYPLLFLLYEEMSDRSLARAIAAFTGQDYHQVLNDVYKVATLDNLSTEAIDRVKKQLLEHGYDRWLLDTSVESTYS